MTHEYTRRNNRLRNYDYSQVGAYFITISAAGRRCTFGHIGSGQLIPSRLGELVAEQWREVPGHYSRIQLDEYVVMPNHLHGILLILWDHVETLVDAGPEADRSGTPDIPGVVGRYKSGVTRAYRRLAADEGAIVWLRGFHDRVIRNERELEAIREYIRSNPLKWQLDRENPGRTGDNPFYALINGVEVV